jgi:hypothetical protein
MERGELSRKDPHLYRQLRAKGLLDHVPTQFRQIPDLLAYYRKHYEGLTRTQLRKRDEGLYHRLRRNGLLRELPQKKTRSPFTRRRIDDLLAFYREHYAGCSRGQLARLDESLYRRLRSAGLLEQVPKITDTVDPASSTRQCKGGTVGHADDERPNDKNTLQGKNKMRS